MLCVGFSTRNKKKPGDYPVLRINQDWQNNSQRMDKPQIGVDWTADIIKNNLGLHLFIKQKNKDFFKYNCMKLETYFSR